MARDGVRNPQSQHQMVMNVLFGYGSAGQPTDWRKWPKFYKDIYNRILSRKLVLVPRAVLKNAEALAESVNKMKEIN